MLSEVALTVLIPYDRGDLLGLAHRQCTVDAEEYLEEGAKLVLRVPSRMVPRFEGFRI